MTDLFADSSLQLTHPKFRMDEENSIWSNFREGFTSSSSSTINQHSSKSSSCYDPFGYNFWTPSRQDLINLNKKSPQFKSPPSPVVVTEQPAVTSMKYLCVFCKSNNEPESIYRSHPLRLNNIVVCPSLRNYTCCICKATGDNAHTIKYCPYNKRGFYATRSHEKCNTNNNSKYRMKVHLVESRLVETAKSSSSMSQQDKETFHRRHFRPIPMTPSSESDDDTYKFESHTKEAGGNRLHSRSSSCGTLNHQLVFFNRTMQKSRS